VLYGKLANFQVLLFQEECIKHIISKRYSKLHWNFSYDKKNVEDTHEYIRIKYKKMSIHHIIPILN
jgi:hypothetical protein